MHGDWKTEETSGKTSFLVRAERGWSSSLQGGGKGLLRERLERNDSLKMSASGLWLGILCQSSVRDTLRNTDNESRTGIFHGKYRNTVNC